MKTFLSKHPKISLFLVNILLISCLIFITEIALRSFAPFYKSVRPTIFPQHYYQYGWGNFPNEKIDFINPDTGEKFSERVNNKRWRDKNRTFKNTKNNYRVLILGDSETFGVLVKNSERYPIVLETLLKKDYRAEVISLSGVGWGTDQILEALQNEGLNYQPNLVIVQFNHNDLADNIYYQILQNSPNDLISNSYKPFYYDIENSQLVKKDNPHFHINHSTSHSTRLKKFLLKYSEIAKRLYSNLHSGEDQFSDYSSLEFDPSAVPLIINKLNLERFKMVFNVSDSTGIINSLKVIENSNISKELLVKTLNNHNYYNSDSIEMATTIFKDIFFQTHWKPEFFKPNIPDTTQLEWQMIYKLFDKIKMETDAHSVDLAIVPTFEEGAANFSTAWHWLSNNDTSIANFLQKNITVANYCSANNIEFINPKKPLQRAKNDIHMNKAGNEILANELYEYIINEKEETLNNYRKKN